MRNPITFLLFCACIVCDAAPLTTVGTQPTAKSTQVKRPPLSEFVRNVYSAFFVGRYQRPGGERFLDTTIYIVAEGLRPDELPAELARTKFQYIKADQIDALAKKVATDSSAFRYFHLKSGPSTSEGWRTLYIDDCAVRKTATGFTHESGVGLGSFGYAEVPIEGQFLPFCFKEVRWLHSTNEYFQL